MANSSIEWTEMTWNPTVGCTKISAGCKFCYAEVMSKRLKGMGQEKYKSGFKAEVILKPHFYQRFFGIITDFGSSDSQKIAGSAHFLEHKLFEKEKSSSQT